MNPIDFCPHYVNRRAQHQTFFSGSLCVAINQDHKKMAGEDTPQDMADRERIFKRFDANGDGKISSTELGDALNALGSVTLEEVKRMMAEIDTDGDGFISFEEFTEFARANRGLIKDVAKIF
ncbi:Polcalcin Ole e 3 [Dionaea muscipula]